MSETYDYQIGDEVLICSANTPTWFGNYNSLWPGRIMAMCASGVEIEYRKAYLFGLLRLKKRVWHLWGDVWGKVDRPTKELQELEKIWRLS